MSVSTTPTPAATPPATVPASQVVPFPLPWGGVPCPPIPGCAPGCGPAGMDALMKCYMDIKNAMAFISKVMIDLINNDPAVAQAMIAAIEKSGSNLPTIGVTNGSDAQPGQVGEFLLLPATANIPITSNSQMVTFGTLPAGDWDCWLYADSNVGVSDIGVYLNPVPPGFVNAGYFWDRIQNVDAIPTQTTLLTPTIRGLTSVASAIAFTINSNQLANGPTAGTLNMFFQARRMR